MLDRATNHVAPAVLWAFGCGELDEAAAAEVAAHVDGCPECRQAGVALAGEGFFGRLRARAPAAAASDTPGSGGTSVAASSDDPYATTPYSAPPVLPGLRDHSQYEIVRELGRGGMGVVYLARNKLLDRLEVLKVVNKQLLGQPGAADRFLREIRSAARLNHPNIVTAYSALEAGELVFAMEYVEGENLYRHVQEHGALPVQNACYYAHQVALGLQHAFEKGLVHRDIKPQNLILARDGKKHRVKILDFGLAKATREGDQTELGLTATGAMMGTPDYMAPEQMLDAGKADIRADIYSLGCTLYHLLTGSPPFKAASRYEVLQAHHSKEARPLDRMREDLPVELAAIVAKMMAQDPARRYQKPLEAALALAPFVKGDSKLPVLPVAPAPVAPRPAVVAAASDRTEAIKSGGPKVVVPAPMVVKAVVESRGAITRKRKKEHIRPPGAKRSSNWRPVLLTAMFLLIGGGLLLLAGIVGLWAAGVLWTETNADGKQRPTPVATFAYDRTGGRPFVHFGTDGPRVVLWSNADEQRPVGVADAGGQIAQFARVYDLSTGEPLSAPMKHDDWLHAWFNPDGTRLGIISGKTAQVRDAITGQAVTALMQHDGELMRIRFSPNGKRVATASQDKTARVWDAATGQPISPPLCHESWVRCATFSPNGKWVATASADQTAQVWDAESGEALCPRMKHDGVVWNVLFSPDGMRLATASRDRTARVWNAASGQPISAPLQHGNWVTRALFSPDGKRVVTSSIDKTARVWDATTGDPVTPPLQHDDSVWDAQFSPDGQRVVTASADKTARVWDAGTGQALTAPLPHDTGVWQATFSPDGKQVITAGDVLAAGAGAWQARTARVWDAYTGTEIRKIPISSATTSP
jgi:WD40 repeat protein/serine/threonine protein kinase